MKIKFTSLLATAFCIVSMLFNVQEVNAQNALTTFGISGTTAASAYSLRKLSTSYIGSAIQVRRSNDNNTSNIGFTANGDLDTATLKTFVGSNSAFVTIWYDQSGNARNLTQPTTSRQPAVISAGVIFRRNGRPTLFFDGTDDGMAFTGPFYLTTNPMTINLVAGSNSTANSARRAVQGTSNWLIGPHGGTHTWYAVNDYNHQASPAWSTTTNECFTVIQPSSASCTSFRNGTAVSSSNNKGVPNRLSLGIEGGFAEPLNGFISEVVSYTTDLSTTNRQLMENSQMFYYNPIPQNALTTFGISGTTAASAYSLRKLSTSYSGSAIQVIRSSDNTTTNIGFTANGDLDTATLKTFVGSNSAFVTIWYDQSGNARNLTQTTSSKRPGIVSAGTIHRRSGKPTVFLDGTDDGMGFTGSNYLTNNPLTVNLVAGSNSSTSGFRRAVQGYNNWLIGPYNATHSWYAGGWNHQASPAWSTSDLENFTVIQPISANCTSFRNGTSVTSGSSKDVPNKLGLGTEGGFAEPLNGFISEVVSYTTDLSTTNRQLMENSQLAYYAPPISDNANLSAINSTAGSYSPFFSSANTSYIFSGVTNATTSITVIPYTEQVNASIQVRINGGSYTTVASGTASGNLALNLGDNIVDIRVTAQDGITTKTYTLTIPRYGNILNNVGISENYINSPAAFSLRKLSTAYVGNAIQVRRSSDNTTANIGFTANGDLDTVTLKTFVGANNGFVSIWYDQSGFARNATQTTNASQPQIVNAGVIFRKNAKPTVYFNNTSLVTQNFIGYRQAFELEIIAGVQNNTSNPTFGGKTTTNLPGPWDMWGTNFYFGNGSAYSWATLTNGINATSGFSQWSFNASSSGGSARRNLVVNGSYNVVTYGDVNNALHLGTRGDGVTSLNGWISEYVTISNLLYNYQREAIENNQSSYFNFSNNNLSSLAISSGSLSPNFSTNTTTYNVSVINSTTSITVTPAVEYEGATISVNVNGGAYAALASGTQSSSLPLNLGANIVEVRVLAVDGTSIKTYTINVTRETNRLTTFNITTANAESAYSLRKLSTDYAGFAIQVRRSSDNATQNIGFSGTGDLDTTALKSFVGNNNGLVSIWYDQSGYSRDLTQTDTAKQPSIITAGIIYKKDFRPTLYLDAINDGMLYTGNAYFNPAFYSVNLVAGSNSNTVAPRRAVQGKYDSYYINFYNWLVGPYNNTHSWFAGGSVSGAFNHQIAQPWSTTKLERFTVIYNEAATYFSTSYRNNVGQNVFVSNTETSPGSLCIGASGAFAEPLDGFLSEVVSYNVGLNETNRLLMENNQATYYEPLANANLNALSLSTGSLSPTFTANTTAYTATVNNTTTSINVTAIPDFVGATLSININAGAFTALTSGNPSNAIALNVGANTIDVKVVSSDGTINKTYTITVTRELPPLTTLANSTVAATAFSLRKLTTHYTGNAIQVRRSNDNTTTNIGFTANGDLDTTALKTFVGNNNGFVSIWYDQSGLARNATQSTNTAQPQIVDAGVIYRKNNVPTIYFNEKYLATQNYIAYNVGITTSTIAGVSAYTYSPTFGNKTNGNTASPLDVWWAYFHYGNGSSFNWFQMLKPIAAESGFSQWSFLASSNGASAFINKTDNGSNTAGSIYQDANTPLVLGSRQDLVTSLIGWISEHITFPSVLNTTDRQVVENNQMFYHGINNANLNNLITSVGTLSPSFAVNTTAYNASVSNNTASITVTPTVEISGATVQVRVNGGSYVTVASGAASAALNLNVGSNTIDARVTALDGTTAKTYTITVTRESLFTWTGATSNVWNLASNWSPAEIPASNVNVVIGNSNNDPVLGSNTIVNDLTLNDTLVIGNTTLTINGVVSGSSVLRGASNSNLTITGTSGTIRFDQSSLSTTNVLRNLTISGSGTTVLGNTLNISGGASSGIVTVGTGATLNTGGNLVLKSNATGTASIGSSVGTISGNVTVERFIPRRRAFRFLSSPVNTSNFISNNWQQATHISGSLTGQNGFDQSNSGTASLFTYNAGTEAWTAIPNTNATNLNIGTGYRMLIRGDRNINLNSTSPQDSANLVLSATGTIVRGNVVFGGGAVSSSPVGVPRLNSSVGSGANNSTVGWSLIGNPYASAVNWASVTKSNVSNTFATWNVNNAGRGSYVYHNGSAGTGFGASNIINSGQAIFVQTIGANPSITFTEASKVSSAPPSHFKKSLSDVLNIDIFIGDRAYDALTVLFDEENNNEYDVNDFIKLVNPEINFYSYLADGTKLAMNNMKEVGEETVVPLGLNGVFNGGSYELKFSNQNTFANADVKLKDKFINKTYDLKSINNLVFTVTADSNSFGENRFELIFSKSATGLNNELSSSNNNFIVFPNPANNVLNLSLTTTREDNYSFAIYNQLGAEISNGTLDFNTKRTHALNIENLSAGVYFIQVKNGKSSQTIKFIK